MARFPFTLDSDTTEVRDALEIGRTQYSRGDLEDAMRWLRRAADIAREQRAEDRATALTRAVGDLGPPRPAAPPRATESVRPRAVESLPVNPAPAVRASVPPQRTATVGSPPAQTHLAPQTPPRAAPTRPVGAPSNASSMAPPRATASSPPATASTPPSAPHRPIVASRPVPIPTSDLDVTTDSFRFPGETSSSEPILLTARKVEPFALDDDSTHVGAAPAGVLAAVAAEAQAAATKPSQAPAAKPATPSARPSTPRAPLSTQPAVTAKVAPQRSAPKPAASAAPRSSETPAQKAPAARVNPAPQPAPQPAMAGMVSIADDEEEDQTSPGVLPQAIQAMRAAAKVKPAVHQAMRAALSKGPHGVTARALGADGLRDGEVEVMVVGASSAVDLAALFS